MECENKLRELLAAERIEFAGSHEIANATLEHFASNELWAKHLKAFAQVRKELISSKKRRAWPKKGTLGIDNGSAKMPISPRRMLGACWCPTPRQAGRPQQTIRHAYTVFSLQKLDFEEEKGKMREWMTDRC
jgi:hypothetical protein